MRDKKIAIVLSNSDIPKGIPTEPIWLDVALPTNVHAIHIGMTNVRYSSGISIVTDIYFDVTGTLFRRLGG